MGASRHNPMSPAYRGGYPEDVPMCGTLVYQRPSIAWMNEHPTANRETGETEDGLKPSAEEQDISIMLTIRRCEPSALFPGEPAKWPQSEITVLGPLLFLQRNQKTGAEEAVPAQMTLADFRRLTPIRGSVAKGIDVPDDDPISAEPEAKAVEPS